ncbi:Protein unc-80 like [Dissostichus eleginoides]|uniref:Protein unc-80 like n=1 Tax=Dissostichus eleginoides TaxID=100907 RepID=A0AAD9F8X4_DISEL|nr:Protein unc-80 like [Dissostichus eleginoides]
MSTSGPQATNGQNVKELDSMKESISDIINQLQDIDPTRLSFSPFLDLDTQISLAPVSDSPESSVEELHSSSHSVSGSQRSLEQPPATDRQRSELLEPLFSVCLTELQDLRESQSKLAEAEVEFESRLKAKRVESQG